MAAGEIEIVFYVGTHKLSAFAGDLGGEEPRILAYQELFQPPGFEKGFVTNMEAAVSSIETLLSNLIPDNAARDIEASVVLANSKLRAYSFSSSQYYEIQRTLTPHEVRAVINQTRSVATLPLSEYVLQVVPESFLVNDLQDIRDPLGLEASRLGVNLKTFTLDFKDYKNISRAFETADITISGFYPRMLTVSEAVLTQDEKDEGVILVDVADDMAQMVVWKSGRLRSTRNVAQGGKVLTQAVADDWQIDFHDAEKVKERFATLETAQQFGDELIPLIHRHGKANHQVPRREFQDKFLPRAKVWLEAILAEVDEIARDEKLAYPHYVFAGGGTHFDGFLEFIFQNFQREARMGQTRHIEAPQEVLLDASLTPALGMFRWLALNEREHERLVAPSGLVEKTLTNARKWFYTYF